MNKIVIDASGTVLGRLASYAAKQALLGNSIAIVNCSEIIITGGRRMIIEEYLTAVKRGGHSLKGPFWIKRDPSMILKRTIRGMLSYRQQRGLSAFKSIKCYNSIPPEFISSNKINISRKISSNSITLKELVKEL